MNSFVERHQSEISGVLSCFDWVAITGAFPAIAPWRCHGGVAGLPGHPRVRLHPVGATAARGAAGQSRAPGLAIEFIRRHKALCQEDRIQAILATRGEHLGFVHIFAAMEPCATYRPWFDQARGQALLKPAGGTCLHSYFCIIARAVARPLVETHRGNLDVRLTAEFHPQFHRVVIRLHREALGRRIALYAVRRGWHKRQSIPTPVSATLAARPSAPISAWARGLV